MQSELQPSVSTNNGIDDLNPSFGFKAQNVDCLWSSCTKHPGHKSFIPVKEFKITHLPVECRDKDVENCIRAMVDLTVRIRVKYVSESRLAGDNFYNVRGKHFARTGSGSVVNVFLADEVEGCCCRECRATNNQRNVVANISVHTARHVVFDQSEVADTVVDLFYDDDSNNATVISLSGSKITFSSQETDECIFECPTHDTDVVGKLRRRLNDFRRYNWAAHKTPLSCGSRLAVVVSHPHGCYKHISIGEWRRAVDDNTPAPTTEASPGRPRSASGISSVVNSDTVIFTIPEVAPIVGHVGQASQESQATGIEVNVEFPDGTKGRRVVWQIDRRVAETKKWLLCDSGITTGPELYNMVLDLPGGETQILQDEQNIDYYWDDLCMSLRLYFADKGNSHHQSDSSTTLC